MFFQPGAKVEAAVAQLTSITQTILRVMPPGITPPLIVQYSAPNVPIFPQFSVGERKGLEVSVGKWKWLEARV